ncbi:MAG TPA: peptidylprolyl isomerase, partial [Flavobacteriaceae bacterium]|nr:peptidylprolyl isomerase [Flavobacteriaceae bacterium]
KKLSTLFLFGIFMSLMACNDKYPDLEDGLYAEFKTNKGTFLAELYFEQTPITVANFVSLAEGTNTIVDSTYQGKHFYDSLTFHRIIKDFMIQGGDPLGTGSGGPGYKFADEIVDSLTFDSKGLLAMANAGPNTNGSQFFITLKETPWLNGRHTIFGKIVKGQEVIDTLGTVETTKPGDKPVEPVIIEKVNIVRKGTAAKSFDAASVFSEAMEKIEKEKAEAAKKMAEAKQEAAANFEKIKTKAETLPSGLMIYFNKKGDGEKPNTGEKVGVLYEGYLTDGTLFDSNKAEVAKKFGLFDEQRAQANGYSPMIVDYSPDVRLIAGFKEGMQLMNYGDVATLFIPAHLAYGKRGAGSLIPPNSDLIFQLELVKLQK